MICNTIHLKSVDEVHEDMIDIGVAVLRADDLERIQAASYDSVCPAHDLMKRW